MKEYVTDALVLGRRVHGARDIIVDLFTKDLGRIEARIVHAQRMNAKLLLHSNVLHGVRARLVRTKGFTLADAVTRSSSFCVLHHASSVARMLGLCVLLRALLPRAHQDARLWSLCEDVWCGNEFSFSSFLVALGYNPLYEQCAVCSCAPVTAFVFHDHTFLCTQCAVQLPENEVVLIYE